MGAYRFAIYWKTQVGVLIKYDEGFIVLDVPFVRIMLNVTKDAHGTNF